MNEKTLAAENINFAYDGDTVLNGVDLALERSELVALLGPNGSGKTTLLKILAGILPLRAGRVVLENVNLATLSRRAVAQRIAMVPQDLHVPFAFTVHELVLLGRTPYTRPLMGESAHDHAAVNSALDLTETRVLANRVFGELSGGEQQRVVIAMALAQEPRILLLDEPTVHLDINHQIEILELIRKLNREQGLSVLATMHDLNLASLYFDRLILLNEGRIIVEGKPSDVLSAERVKAVFGARVVVQAHPTKADAPQIVLLPTIQS